MVLRWIELRRARRRLFRFHLGGDGLGDDFAVAVDEGVAASNIRRAFDRASIFHSPLFAQRSLTLRRATPYA